MFFENWATHLTLLSQFLFKTNFKIFNSRTNIIRKFKITPILKTETETNSDKR